MAGLQILGIVLFVLCFASFGWAIKHFFTADDPQQGMQAIKILGSVFAICHLVTLVAFYDPWPWFAAIAALLYLLSLTLFWWALQTNRSLPLSLAYSLDEPTHLVKHGPYRWIRHPFYSAYILAWLAGFLCTGQWWLLVSLLLMYRLYWKAAKFEETKFLSSALASQYQDYQRQTSMFIPFL